MLAAGDAALPFEDARRAEVQRLSDAKFSTWEWIYGQSRAADLVRRARFACGTVEAHASLDRGVLTALRFAGDFQGALPAEGLAARLVGLRYDRAVFLTALSSSSFAGLTGESIDPESPPVSSYFDGLSPQELLDLLF
jgi:lipoate-protein ligase A